MQIQIPTHWSTLSQEGEAFYTRIAKELVDKLTTIEHKVALNDYLMANRNFALDEKNWEAEAGAKETQLSVIEFLTEVFDGEFTEDEIVEFRYETYDYNRSIV